MGGKSIFNTASSERHSAPSPVLVLLPSCSSHFGLRREPKGAANPAQPPWTRTEPLPALGSVLAPAQRRGPVGALWDGVSRVRTERVKGSRPSSRGSGISYGLQQSAGQVIKMTNEHKSIMKSVFSGNARHERKSTSTWVVGAVDELPRGHKRSGTIPFSCPPRLAFPWHHRCHGRLGWLCLLAFPWDFGCLLEQSVRDAGCCWMLARHVAPGYRRLGIADGALGKFGIWLIIRRPGSISTAPR